MKLRILILALVFSSVAAKCDEDTDVKQTVDCCISGAIQQCDKDGSDAYDEFTDCGNGTCALSGQACPGTGDADTDADNDAGL